MIKRIIAGICMLIGLQLVTYQNADTFAGMRQGWRILLGWMLFSAALDWLIGYRIKESSKEQ